VAGEGQEQQILGALNATDVARNVVAADFNVTMTDVVTARFTDGTELAIQPP
jgi:hypothetical protein